MYRKGTSKVNNFETTKYNGIISDDLDTANVFNDNFINIPSKLKEHLSLNFTILLILNLMMTQTLTVRS